MYRQILIPTERAHTIDLPAEMYGKQIEVIAFEITEPARKNHEKPKFLSDIEFIPDFPSLDEIRKDSWPEKW